MILLYKTIAGLTLNCCPKETADRIVYYPDGALPVFYESILANCVASLDFLLLTVQRATFDCFVGESAGFCKALTESEVAKRYRSE